MNVLTQHSRHPANRVVSPERIVVSFGFATTLESYERARWGSPDLFEAIFHESAENGADDYLEYVVEPAQACLQAWRSAGAEILLSADVRAVGAALERHDVLIHVSHCAQGRLQFGEEMVRPEAFADALPRDRGTALDLTSCSSEREALAIKVRRPHLMVHYNGEPLPPSGWLGVYALVAQYVREGGRSYPDVLDLAIATYVEALRLMEEEALKCP